MRYRFRVMMLSAAAAAALASCSVGAVQDSPPSVAGVFKPSQSGRALVYCRTDREGYCTNAAAEYVLESERKVLGINSKVRRPPNHAEYVAQLGYTTIHNTYRIMNNGRVDTILEVSK